ncbi:hypothetical protein Hsero_3361 [Herbaspirillum seropedicae SmR1]|uniref:Uncharacterized protein n=1 Tax=Herbaspirillum seropedicae (strain SmR1) TaxID=757424 RepID=D8J259_HERSS|nr:hypothetical protein Hsero_3361 [Herbaspirillum seropedicae SmR1]
MASGAQYRASAPMLRCAQAWLRCISALGVFPNTIPGQGLAACGMGNQAARNCAYHTTTGRHLSLESACSRTSWASPDRPQSQSRKGFARGSMSPSAYDWGPTSARIVPLRKSTREYRVWIR